MSVQHSLPAARPGPGQPASQWWWKTTQGRHRTPYAVLAFAPDYGGDRIVALADTAVCSADSWEVMPGTTDDGLLGLRSWRRPTIGTMLSLVLAGHYPMIAVMAPGFVAAKWTRALGTGIFPTPAARSAVRRFVDAARPQGARVVETTRLSALIAQSGLRSAHAVEIQARLAEIAGLDRVKTCPRCAAGCETTARWCPRCEYEFTHADDHAHDRNVLQRRFEMERLQAKMAELHTQAFPPPPRMRDSR